MLIHLRHRHICWWSFEISHPRAKVLTSCIRRMAFVGGGRLCTCVDLPVVLFGNSSHRGSSFCFFDRSFKFAEAEISKDLFYPTAPCSDTNDCNRWRNQRRFYTFSYRA